MYHALKGTRRGENKLLRIRKGGLRWGQAGGRREHGIGAGAVGKTFARRVQTVSRYTSILNTVLPAPGLENPHQHKV